MEGGNDSRNFDGVKELTEVGVSNAAGSSGKKFSEFGPSGLHWGEADILGIPACLPF